MKLYTLLTIIFFFSLSNVYAQQKDNNAYLFKVNQCEEGGGDDVFFDKGIMYIPERDDENLQFYIKKYDLKTLEYIGKYTPPKAYSNAPGYVIENDFIYFHTDDNISKVNMKTQKVVWETAYESGMSAQIAPELLGKYIGISLDDLVLLVDKETGKKVVNITGEDLDQTMVVIDNLFIYGYFETGIMKVYDIQKKKHLFKIKVGDQLGENITKDGNNLIFPSTNVNLTCVDAKTGKKKWYWNHPTLEGGCGHGFNDGPVKVGDKLFANQRETGMYIFDKNTGKLLKEIDFEESVSTQIIEYKGKLIIVGEENLFAMDPATYEYESLASYQINEDMMPFIDYKNGYLCIHDIGNETSGTVRLFKLDQLLK